MGGKIRRASKAAFLVAKVEGHNISTNALVIDEIGRDEEGKTIDVLFGALAMQQWGIRLVPKEDRLDLTHFPDEFVEY